VIRVIVVSALNSSRSLLSLRWSIYMISTPTLLTLQISNHFRLRIWVNHTLDDPRMSTDTVCTDDFNIQVISV